MKIRGKPDGWTPQTELEHFMKCPVCHEWFDCRDPANIAQHWHEGPEEPNASSEPSPQQSSRRQ